MDNPIDTMIIDRLRAQIDELRETCLHWSREYQKLLEENETLRDKLNELQTL